MSQLGISMVRGDSEHLDDGDGKVEEVSLLVVRRCVFTSCVTYTIRS